MRTIITWIYPTKTTRQPYSTKTLSETTYHQSGVVGLFPNQAEEIRDLLESVKRNVEQSA